MRISSLPSRMWRSTMHLVFFSLAFVSVQAGQKVGARLVESDQLPLRTNGRYIVGTRGQRVKWACVNWYGAYSTTHAVGGLEKQTMGHIAERIVELGFNCVRMMYSTQGYVHNPVVANETVAANPDLMGKRFLEIFDKTIEALTDRGLMVIVNNHNSKSGWCCHYSQDEGLWYVPEYSEEVWIESLVFFANRYRTNPLVVAIDLRNEVHDFEDTHLEWGKGDDKTDWAAAAVRAGNRVLEVSPDVLIVIMAMCFGMDLREMKNRPLQNELMYPNRVVYQTHNYLEYQFFDNVTKMFGPYSELRNIVLVIMLSLILIVALQFYLWGRLGKPQPPQGTVMMSVGGFLVFFSAIAAFASWQIAQFGNKFCAVSVRSDVIPWFAGSIIFGGVSVMLALTGAWRLSERGVAADGNAEPAQSDKLEKETEAVVPAEREEITLNFCPGPLGLEADDWSCGKIDAVASGSQAETLGVKGGWQMLTVDGKPYAEDILDKCAAGKQEYEVVFTKQQKQAEQRKETGEKATSQRKNDSTLTGEPVLITQSMVVETSGEVNAETKPEEAATSKCCCCQSGCNSCTLACAQLSDDVVGLVTWCCSVTPSPTTTQNSRRSATWDVGMCCGLQVFVLCTIVILLLLFIYVFMHIVPTYWWMERHLDGLWGFALEDEKPWTAPVWMGEFGQHVRGQYWLNFVRYLSIRDVDFAYWALNGLKWAEGAIDVSSGDFINFDEPRWENETFGILRDDYDTVRYPWMMLDLQALMDSPARWMPDSIPCSWSLNGACGAR